MKDNVRNRFFPMGIKKGDPIAKRGVIEGIIKMAVALDKLSVHNGRVDWANDEPKIIIERVRNSGQ